LCKPVYVADNESRFVGVDAPALMKVLARMPPDLWAALKF
jgi:hypothetical protein